jgi:predicted enzyme related to lactoylglutathione lyase
VPEKKGPKNRLHLDLRTRDLEGELQRVRALGAALVTQDPIEEDGWVWYVLSDPDGNELCIVRPPEDYWSASSS